MIPYADFLYFGVLLYVVVPTLLLGLAGRAAKRWILIATIGMLAVHYGGRVRLTPALEVRELYIVAAYALFEWVVARAFLQVRAHGKRRWPFCLALLGALLPLIAAKFVPLLAPQFQIGFLGISYLTFRSLDVIICTQDRLITSLRPSQFFAYLFFFATISSGPIDRYRRFDVDWKHRRTRAEFVQDLDGAVHRVFTGFLYKFILAALIKQYWLDPIAARSGFPSMLAYMYAYSFYLFFDFAGYSAFAIGLSYLFGVHTPENFDRPFLARNIREFWNRWHITLSWWLRDHVYMRFVMAATKGRWFKNAYVASYLGLFLAFTLMGLWHGTALHYVLYGVYHGTLLSAHEAFGRWNKRRKLWGDGPLWQAAGICTTFNAVCFGFLLFSGHLTQGGAENRDATTGAQTYEGRYEKASCAELGGWAWDQASPQTPVSVDIYADGALLATVRAELFRPDLAAGGKGNGAHGFVYVPPTRLKDGWPHTTAVKIAGTDVALSGSPPAIVCGMNVVALDGYEGSHEMSDCAHIRGWAWDATQPDRTARVDIYDGQTLLGTVAADQPHADSGHGNHGFVYLVPTELRDGRTHSISVRISATNIPLENTPRVFTCTGRSLLAQPTSTTPMPAPNAPSGVEHVTPGAALTYADNGDGSISALSTALMWEKKVKLDGAKDAANLHDADNCYPWFGQCATGGIDCRTDADCGANGPCNAEDCQTAAPDGLTIFEWVAQLNANNFAGHGDWRLPTSTELYSIVNPLEEGDRATNTAFKGVSCGAGCSDLNEPACSCTDPGLYWAAPQSAPGPDDSWMAFFYCNGHLFLDLKSNKFCVRAVRGSKP